MRILAGGRVLFLGQHQCPEFQCPQVALPEQFKVLLCLVDGAARRQQIQAQLNRTHPPADGELIAGNEYLRHGCSDRRAAWRRG